jgi:hypothetical protein
MSKKHAKSDRQRTAWTVTATLPSHVEGVSVSVNMGGRSDSILEAVMAASVASQHLHDGFSTAEAIESDLTTEETETASEAPQSARRGRRSAADA